jgi:hypothetical protein
MLGVAALAMGERHGCNVPNRSSRHRDLAEKFSRMEASARSRITETEQSTLNVEVFMHTISATEDGLLSVSLRDTVERGKQASVINIDDQEDELKGQFDALVQRFAPHGILFDLVGTDSLVDAQWANGTEELAMKTYLRTGDYRTLNLYFTDYVVSVDEEAGTEENLLGTCYFPTEAPEGSDEYNLDGCLIWAQTIPGGVHPEYHLGITAVHEVGHWFGLEHVFHNGDSGEYESGCFGPGDGVDDTPASANATFACEWGRDSCPDQPGLDPVFNYMDYSNE